MRMDNRKTNKCLLTDEGSENRKGDRKCSSRPGPDSGYANGNATIDLTLEDIFNDANVKKAVAKVCANKGAPGIDGMTVYELPKFMEQHWAEIKRLVLDGRYRPSAVRRVEIPKDNGKKRQLGISTVMDRVVMQAVNLALSPYYEMTFSDSSYGFRKGRNAQQAVLKCQEYINEGYHYVVDMDLEKFFDTVNQDMLISKMALRIKDGRILSLVHRFMKADIFANGMFFETDRGLVQGNPLSPLCSGIFLDEIDKRLEKLEHKAVRYADYTED